MGVARLLAKGWVVFCLFAGAHALAMAISSGMPLVPALQSVGICVVLFGAMGLLFAGGFGGSAGFGAKPLLQRLKPHHFIPGFYELVFVIFAGLSFANQVFFAPQHIQGGAAGALQAAIFFVVPGQRELVSALTPCSIDGGRVFASSFTWLLAIIFLASALSRLHLMAGIIRLERVRRPEMLGATTLALVLGIVAVIGIQLLFIGSVYAFIPCSAFADISGALLIGLAPLMLSYLIVAGLLSAMASSPE